MYCNVKVFLKNVFSHWHHTHCMSHEKKKTLLWLLNSKFIAADWTRVGNNAEKKKKQSVGGVQSLLRVAAVHDEEEAFGELRADPPSRGRDAFPSADQKVGEQLLAVALARFIGLLKDTCNSKDEQVILLADSVLT